MEKSHQINFNLPLALIKGIDAYLAKHELDIGRSALLKFCLTYHPQLTPIQKQKSVRLQDDLYRNSNGVVINVSLRCHWKLKNGTNNIAKICDTLTYLNLSSIFDDEQNKKST